MLDNTLNDVRVTALSAEIGVTVDGLDPRQPLADEQVAQLRGLLAKHHLLHFRLEDLDAEDHVRISSYFGKVISEHGRTEPYAMISNAGEEAIVKHSRRLLYHADAIFSETPYSTLSLYALEVPESNAPTVYARASAKRLPEQLRDRLRGLRGVFVIGWGGGDNRYNADEVGPDAIIKEQQLLLMDPLSGEEVVLVDEIFFDRIPGWDRIDIESLRSEVHAVIYAEDTTYVHPWQPGDLVVWNNLTLQHSRPAFSESGRRVLRRVITVGE
ncbi:MAG: hypothetical protein JWP11_2611 [Frankiales bacterium]|nr:hypothetical protein [Frankiales bacterium]